MSEKEQSGRLPAADAACTASPVLRTEPQERLGPSGRVPHGAMPGPWSASEMTMDSAMWAGLNEGTFLHIVQANWDGWSGDVVACVWADDDHDEAATARLIAAAPELASALEAMIAAELSGSGSNMAKARHAARAVLAKAKGEQQ